MSGQRISYYVRILENTCTLYAELAVEHQRGRLSRSGRTGAAWFEHRLANQKELAPSTVREDRCLAEIITRNYVGR